VNVGSKEFVEGCFLSAVWVRAYITCARVEFALQVITQLQELAENQTEENGNG
jgi:hypothetical protein